MKAATFIVAVLLLSSCGGKTESVSSQTAAPAVPKTEKGAAPAKADMSSAPVDLTSLGITPDKTSVSYRIKVNAEKPIEEVHLALKEMDATGKVVGDTTLVWQNIVGSTRKPIEAGKTYEDHSALDADVAKAEVSLKEVVFKDGTRWSPR